MDVTSFYLPTRIIHGEGAVAISQNILQAAAGGTTEQRHAMLVASSMANMSCGAAGLGLVHAMSHGLPEVPHGYACGALLPHVMRFNMPSRVGKIARLAPALGVRPEGLSEEELARAALRAMDELYERIGFPSKWDVQWGPLAIEDRVEKPLRTVPGSSSQTLVRSPRAR